MSDCGKFFAYGYCYELPMPTKYVHEMYTNIFKRILFKKNMFMSNIKIFRIVLFKFNSFEIHILYYLHSGEIYLNFVMYAYCV